MQNKKEVAVVIPIYKLVLNRLEEISLQQALKVFLQYDIIIIAPEKLWIQNENSYYCIERFPDKYFRSVETYNDLMLSVFFYERFLSYEYILIYQLDAFVFSDKLAYFTRQGYDYIGAPWLYGTFQYIDKSHCIWYVGNGGLSLRKVTSFIRILNEKKPLENDKILNEDMFFSTINNEYFSIAPKEIALQFSFERQVEKCFAQNSFNLPFGCHAWGKYNFKFWKPYIEQAGYSLRGYEDIGYEDLLLKKNYNMMMCLTKLWECDRIGMAVNKALTQNINEAYEKYILFGAGYLGKGLGKWLECNHIPFQGYCDNNEEIQSNRIDGYPVMRPKELMQYKGKVKIIVSILSDVKEVLHQLQKMGFKYDVDYITFEDIISIITKAER